MFSFKKGKGSKNDPNAIDASEVLSSPGDVTSDEELETTLSIPDGWNVTDEERYVFAFHNSQAPKLNINQISIYGMEFSKLADGRILTTGLIRSTVTQSIKFGPTTILLLDGDKELIAKKEFDLSKLDSIPPNAARPWKFVFNKEDIVKEVNAQPEEWLLAFEIKQKHVLDLDESWEKSIAEDVKTTLAQIVENAAPLKPGEVNFMGINAQRNENNDLVVTLLIRNGAEKGIALQQLPLGVKDASGEEITRGAFKLDDLTIKANTSKPWTFIFPANSITKEEIDLSRWQVYPIQN
ncbi:accessory Sec system S-layer assembly protein [Ornithinibacillus scapharcae]|uniref:accessory Sec system S-layer assembly protein n=1 Tax=Ornithinibacillus scapharcae TaxID=1147159 RepID=UPI000225B842|nr:accessory Sec system S-layer assembly protein [Ornithinibacillus scapharcae]